MRAQLLQSNKIKKSCDPYEYNENKKVSIRNVPQGRIILLKAKVADEVDTCHN